MRCAGCGSSGPVGRAAGRSARGLEAALLAAREEREDRIRRLAERAGGGSLVSVGLSIPGPEKSFDGAFGAIVVATDLLLERFAGRGIAARRIEGAGAGGTGVSPRPDGVLGPLAALAVAAPPERAKSICVALEESLRWGRLLDLDVYAADGGWRQVGRGALGLPGRRCLLCDQPARECILLRRHEVPALLARTRALAGEARRSALARRLAAALVRGARAELELTPKPGLVDRRDSGSHPDLTYAAMLRSIDLLPAYYADLIRRLESNGPLPDGDERRASLDEETFSRCVQAGREAERRMEATVGANSHRGYLFLSGLVLVAAWEAGSTEAARLRPAIAATARRFFARERMEESAERAARAGEPVRPGWRLRRRDGIGGVEAEALAGLPAVFEHALPHLRAERPSGRTARRDAKPLADARDRWRALAEIMGALEDTTALHRCGRAGLERVRSDGLRLRELLVRGRNPVPSLERWNEEYRAARLTMGGVADCLALAIALAGLDGRSAGS